MLVNVSLIFQVPVVSYFLSKTETDACGESSQLEDNYYSVERDAKKPAGQDRKTHYFSDAGEDL